MIQLRNVTIRFGARILFEKANVTIYKGERIGLIGENGAGKTTLFSLILQKLTPDAGDLDIPKLAFAAVEQETPAYAGKAIDYVLDGDTDLRKIEQALLVAEEKHDGMAIAHLHGDLQAIDAYTAPSRAAQLLRGLGFSQEEQEKSVNSFSGGWRIRLNLAKALMKRSDVLLLDEPTNHLDLDAILWLEEWLKSYPGTFILISHDRDFLDKTVNRIFHIHDQQIKSYTGNYTTFETLRAQALLLQQAMYEKQQRKLAHLQSFVDRFRAKASKAKQAQSRLKAIERMEVVCAVQSESPFQFEFKTPTIIGNPLMQLHKVKAGYGDHIVLNHVNFTIAPKDRIAILGPNGAGKSTLIKILAGELAPLKGTREKSGQLKIGYFAQHQLEHLDINASPLLHLERLDKKLGETAARGFLGGFGFIGDAVFAPVKQFSGGEKSRLALAMIVYQNPHLLLLDEPTNHLDLEMREALALALQGFEGAMVLVSHDRFLVRTVADQLYLVANQAVDVFDGDLDDYQTFLMNYRKEQIAKKPAKAKKKSAAEIEKEMHQIELELKQLQEIMQDEILYEPKNQKKLNKYAAQQESLQAELKRLEEAWLLSS